MSTAELDPQRSDPELHRLRGVKMTPVQREQYDALKEPEKQAYREHRKFHIRSHHESMRQIKIARKQRA